MEDLLTTSNLNEAISKIEKELEEISYQIQAEGIIVDGISLGHVMSKFQLLCSITKRISTQLIKENENRSKSNSLQ